MVEAQEKFMMMIHGDKIRKYQLNDIVTDYKLIQAMTQELALLDNLKDQDIEIKDFQKLKADLVLVLNAHKNRVIFQPEAKTAIDGMVTYLNSINSGDIIEKNTVVNWDQMVNEKKAFLEMVKTSGFSGLDKFVEYFGNKDGILYKNKLLENGFGEIPIQLIKSFHKAHQSVSLKYNGKSENGEWGGAYDSKYDGMHFGLETSFIKSLTNK